MVNTLGGRVDTKAGIIHRRGAGETATRKRRLPIRIPRCLSGFLGRWDVAEFAGTNLKMIEDVNGHHHPEFQADIASRIGRREFLSRQKYGCQASA